MADMRHDPTFTPIGDDEIAAALAAVRCYVEQDQPAASLEAPDRPAWSAAAALETQNLPATRNGAYRAWGSAERARRAHRWSYGIVGM